MSNKSTASRFSAVQKELAELGIAKAEVNQQQRYNYRGIDSVMNALAPVLAKNGVMILSKTTSHSMSQITTKNGGVMHHHIVSVDFHIVSEEGALGPFGSMGEAMDSGDKGLNKAIGAAYKYWVLTSLCIPTEGHADADSESPEMAEPAPAQLVSASEIGEIRRMLSETNTDPEMYCKFLGVESVEQIELAKFAGVMQQLQRKAQKMAEQYAREQSMSAAADEAEAGQ